MKLSAREQVKPRHTCGRVYADKGKRYSNAADKGKRYSNATGLCVGRMCCLR